MSNKGDGLPTSKGGSFKGSFIRKKRDETRAISETIQDQVRADFSDNSASDKGSDNGPSESVLRPQDSTSIYDKYKRQVGPTEVTCSCCHTNKTRVQVGISPNKKRKYYVDESGDYWAGKKCPDCRRKAHANYMKRRRKAEKTGEPMEYKRSEGGASSKIANLFKPLSED